MSIQGNLNQAVSLASLLASQSGTVKNRQEGLGIQARQEQAIRGLKDIEGNLERVHTGGKSYNKAELKNIEARTEQYQKDIYDAKSAALNPKLSRYIATGEKAYATGKGIQQPALSSQLSKIQQMTQKAREGLTAKQIEHRPSKEFVNKVLEGVVSPLNDPRKGGI